MNTNNSKLEEMIEKEDALTKKIEQFKKLSKDVIDLNNQLKAIRVEYRQAVKEYQKAKSDVA